MNSKLLEKIVRRVASSTRANVSSSARLGARARLQNGIRTGGKRLYSTTSQNISRLSPFTKWAFGVGSLTVGAGILAFNARNAFAEDKKSAANAHENKLPQEFMNILSKLLKDRFKTDIEERESATKGFSYHHSGLPDAVAYVETAEEISEVLKACNKYKIPIVAWGSGTSLEGHTLPERGGISLNLSRMKKVIKLHAEDMDVIVEPGLTYNELNDLLKPHGLFFPVDPGPGASIGGMIGTSCSGTNAVRYGTMKDNVLSLKVALPDGRIIKTGNRARKSSAGYDLTHLFIGSEGTLGVVVEATLKLQNIPAYKTVAICNFKTLKDAGNTVLHMMRNGVRIGKVELLDDVCIKSVNMSSDVKLPEMPTLLFEFSGTQNEVESTINFVKGITDKFSGTGFRYAKSNEERDEIWRARKEALWACPNLRDIPTETMITDACVPISSLADCLEETKKDIISHNLVAPIVGHVGDGNFHLFVLIDPKNPNEIEAAKHLNDKLVLRAIGMDGTCTGEHGVGVGKKKYLPIELGPETVNVMRALKKTLDPNNIMNPDKIFD
jgi:D-lactate dehydrogenase (cytochrome)